MPEDGEKNDDTESRDRSERAERFAMNPGPILAHEDHLAANLSG